MNERGYGSPTGFRQALTAKLRAKAQGGPWTLAQLQRYMAYDRLLERLYLTSDGWIVKGAAALLARDIGVRATIDIDVYREAALEVADAQLRAAAGRDIGDWFSFEVGVARPIADDVSAMRLPVTAYVGTTVWASFHVDLVGQDVRMTGEPEPVPPLAQVDMTDIHQHGYRAYPLVDHAADKVVAMFELHGARRLPSTRFRDLVDLVAIAIGASVDAHAQLTALAAQAKQRGIALPASFEFRTERCGSRATQRRPGGHCCQSRTLSRRRSPSSRRSSTRCSTGARAAGGTRPNGVGRRNRACPALEGEHSLNVGQPRTCARWIRPESDLESRGEGCFCGPVPRTRSPRMR
jgi:hypothetical protein